MQVLWYLSIALELVTLARLAQLRLLGRHPYRAFAVMQSAMLLRDLLLVLIPLRSLAYTLAWEITLPIVLLTQAHAGVECYRAIAKLYPNIGPFASKLFAAALGVTAVLSFAGLPFELANWNREPLFHALLVCYRWTDTLLAGGLILATAFLSRFPSPLLRRPANLLRHTALLASYFSLYAVAYFVPVAHSGQMDMIRMAAVCVLYSCWPLSLSSQGELSEPWSRLCSDVQQVPDPRDAAARAYFAAGK